MAVNFIEKRKTAIIPVIKHDDLYTISVSAAMWNEIQVLLLEGAITKKVTLEFKIEDIKKEESKKENVA